jgi:vacuolar protein sorting-associated protein 35
VIALIDRLAAYAAREAENEDPDETKRQEEAAARRLAEKVKVQKARLRQDPSNYANNGVINSDPEIWQSPTDVPVIDSSTTTGQVNGEKDGEKAGTPVKKFRGIPEDAKLFEVFWQQVVELIKVGSNRPGHLNADLNYSRPDRTCPYKTLQHFLFH